jgi:Flp pilus assembly pilin Flp
VHHHAQNTVEYGLLVATIALIVMLGINAFGSQIMAWFIVLAGAIAQTGTGA